MENPPPVLSDNVAENRRRESEQRQRIRGQAARIRTLIYPADEGDEVPDG